MMVKEIFHSIDGEGLRTGELATFIRLAGCNIRCTYCDTDYALRINQGKPITVEEIMAEVEKHKCGNVTLTGGEPLIHKDVEILIDRLVREGYRVNIETNGAVDISPYINQEVLITMDYKLPSSGVESSMFTDNLFKLRYSDVLKFVVGSVEDLDRMSEVMAMYPIRANIYVSPVFGKITPLEIVDYMKENQLTNVRLQVQLHKIIWEPSERGV